MCCAWRRAVAAGTNALLAHERPAGGSGRDASRLNELHAAWDLGAWQLAAGKKVLGWDVGYAFRPNDVVQQEARTRAVRADARRAGRC
jgi:hypothetical protein